jgi:hypothetical protein
MLAKLPKHRMNLLKAADLIERRGHTKYTREDEHGLCLHGAISMAVNGDAWDDIGCGRAIALVASYVRSIGGETYGDFCCSWNNAPARTKDEVVTALRNAATWGL